MEVKRRTSRLKLFNLNHIALIPYTACNFRCSYCVNSVRMSIKDWNENSKRVLTFLQKLPPKAIMVSGGEPLLWDWSEFLNNTSHVYYFLSNLSVIPTWLIHPQIRLIIAAYHKTGMSIEKFIENVKKVEKPVFVKVVFVDEVDKRNVERLWRENITASRVPQEGRRYKTVPSECTTETYARRFRHERKGLSLCRAGTEASFEIRGSKLSRCSLWPLTQHTFAMCKLTCPVRYCRCEWQQFSELSGSNDNDRWQQFVESGKW